MDTWVQVTGHESGEQAWVNLAHVREMNRPNDEGPTWLWWINPTGVEDRHASIEETPEALMRQVRRDEAAQVTHTLPPASEQLARWADEQLSKPPAVAEVYISVEGGHMEVATPAGVRVRVADHDVGPGEEGPVIREYEPGESGRVLACHLCGGTGRRTFDDGCGAEDEVGCGRCNSTGLIRPAKLRRVPDSRE